MTDIRKSLDTIATAIEALQKTPTERPTILDRELSGNKINGGTITQFSSTGIVDKSSKIVLTVKDDGVHVDTVYVKTINTPVTVKGDLTVEGTVHAKRMHVDEITADIRQERTDPLSFIGKNNNTAYGQGLIWPGGEYTKQFMLMERPDRFFATESIELRAGKIYMINGQNVLAQDELGRTVTKSNLKKVGTLESLAVDTTLTVDNFLHYNANTQSLGLGTESPNGTFGIASWDHEFVITGTEDRKFKLGTYTSGALEFITDDTARITIESSGSITLHKKVVIEDKLGVGVKNFTTDADITTAGPVRFQDKKFEVGSEVPTSGNYIKGDIVWNTQPTPSGYVGWICIKGGTPGEWKRFGQISS
tara:strand:+ start:1043 stop:2131 length:1089 start_codon:yes stop_codon:yes gene_type:complete